ncbi:MAG: hypothetical protein L0154_26435 [Chloroflexi bacterium]|nr:hypothetical protein [Chloroflexota bacterium]
MIKRIWLRHPTYARCAAAARMANITLAPRGAAVGRQLNAGSALARGEVTTARGAAATGRCPHRPNRTPRHHGVSCRLRPQNGVPATILSAIRLLTERSQNVTRKSPEI